MCQTKYYLNFIFYSIHFIQQIIFNLHNQFINWNLYSDYIDYLKNLYKKYNMKRKEDQTQQIEPDQNDMLKQTLLGKQIDQQKDKNPKKQSSISVEKKKKIHKNYMSNNILQTSNMLSTIFFQYISSFVWYGSQFQLTKQNIPELPTSQTPRIQFSTLSNTLHKQQKNKSKQGIILSKSIFKAYKKQLIWLFVQTLLFVAFSMYAPIVTDQIISYIQQGPTQDRSLTKGVGLFVIVFFMNFFKIIANSHVFFNFGVLGFNLSNTLSLLIYEKSLKHPVLCLKKYSVSQIINYSQVDAQRMTYMGFQLTALLFTPVQVLVGLWLMYSFIGISFLSGIAVMIITILCTFICSKISVKANESLLKAKDQRMKTTQEMFNIIRYIKINAFEKYFWKKLNIKRQAELNLNKKKLTYQVLTIFIYWLASPLILSMTFATYTWLGNDMSATEAFTTIMLFRILQYPIRLLPTAISEMIQIWTSVKRIQKFLLSEEIQQTNIKIGNQKDIFAIKITNGTFAWGKQKQKQKQNDKQTDKKNKKQEKASNKFLEEPSSLLTDQILSQEQRGSLSQSILAQSLLSNDNKQSSQNPVFIKALQDIDLQIPSKSFTMIIGDIGSGKSSLLLSILNQTKCAANSLIQINGNIAYVPQKPWLMSASLQDNILFTSEYNQSKFKEVLHYSSMESDVALLVDGIKTEIGEKGTNLSGGQKARIGLARALYSDRDIYLLDDIISAVDVHVGDFIMKQTILTYLKHKTVVMPTHAVKFAQYADKIIIMKKGRIVKSGPYELIRKTEQFRQICMNQEKKTEQIDHKNEQKVIQDLKKIKSVVEQSKKASKQKAEASSNITQKIVQQLIMPQDHKKGSISLSVYKQYIQLNGGALFLALVSVCMFLWLTFTTMSNIWMQKWCQDPQQGNEFLYIFLALSITSSVFMLIRAYTLVIGGIKCGGKVHKKVIKTLLYASLNQFYNRVPLGRIINRLSKDLREIDQTIGYCVGGFLVSIFGLVGTLIICIYASSYFIIIPMILVAYVSNRLRVFYMKTQRQCVRLQNITSSPIVSGFLSTINGIETIRAYNLSEQFLKQQIKKVQLNKRLRISRQTLQSWFCQRLSFLTFFINMSAIGYCIFSQNQNSSLVGLLLTYALTLADDIIDTMFSFTYLQNKMISVERVSNFMQIQPQVGYKQYTKKWNTRQQGYKQQIQKGQIQFKSARIRYRDDLPDVLKAITLKIAKGQKIGVVGRTGAGKSTIINCLLRILDTYQGEVLIDGKNIKDYFIKDLRYAITMIDQQPTLINGTFKENLDPRDNYTEQQLTEIIKQCNLSDVVQQKGGLSSKVSNDSLSVGQKQLLCICRAFLKNSKIVLIDEATANIDQKNDQLIQQVISNKFKESTVLTIAHRLSTLKNSDKILVLSQGKVIQWGTPAQLMQLQNGIYRQMCIKGKITSQFLI